MIVTFADGSTDVECDESGFVADASLNLTTAIAMSTYEANDESVEDVDLAEADLCLDPDCIGTIFTPKQANWFGEDEKRIKKEERKHTTNINI